MASLRNGFQKKFMENSIKVGGWIWILVFSLRPKPLSKSPRPPTLGWYGRIKYGRLALAQTPAPLTEVWTF